MTEAAVSPGSPRAVARPRTGASWGFLAVLAVLVASFVPFTVAAQTSDDEAERAAREIQAARDQANAAADAVFQALSLIHISEPTRH